MSWSDWGDWLKNGLPTYDGGKDRTSARKMLDNMGGPDGFKTKSQNNADGSVTTVQTKGSMPPEVTTTKVEKVIKAGLQFHGRILNRIVQLTAPYTKAISGYTGSTNHTSYFKVDPPPTTMPNEVPEPGQTFEPDVVLFDGDKRFSPVSSQKVEPDNWIFAGPSGRRYQLSAEVLHGDDTTTVIIRNRGEWTFGGATTVGAGTVIKTLVVPFSMAIFQSKDHVNSGAYDNAQQWGVFGSAFGYGDTVYHKPNGSEAMIHRFDCVADYVLWPRLWVRRDSFFEHIYDANLTPPYVLNLSNYYCLSQVFKVVVTEPYPGGVDVEVSTYKDQGDCYTGVRSDSAHQSGSHDYTSAPGLETWSPVNVSSPYPNGNLSETALYVVMYDKNGELVEITGEHTVFQSDITTASGIFTFTNTDELGVDSGYWYDNSPYGGSSHTVIYVNLTQHIPSGSKIINRAWGSSDEMTIAINGIVAWRGFYTLFHNQTTTTTYAGFSDQLLPPGGEVAFGYPGPFKQTVQVGADVSDSSGTTTYQTSFIGLDYSGATNTGISPPVVSVLTGLRDIYTRLHWRSNNVIEASHKYYGGYGFFTGHPDGEGLVDPTSDSTPYDAEMPDPVLITPNGAITAPYEGWRKGLASWNPRTGEVKRGTDADGWV